MSYDVWVSSFRKDDEVAVSRDTLREMFGPYLTEIDSTFWRVRYDDTNGADIYLHLHASDPKQITGVSVNRPCGDDRLWASLTRLLRAGPFVFYAPDGPPVIADSAVTADLPSEMIAALGEPVCLSDSEIIIDVW
jgi:hypothetical protein